MSFLLVINEINSSIVKPLAPVNNEPGPGTFYVGFYNDSLQQLALLYFGAAPVIGTGLDTFYATLGVEGYLSWFWAAYQSDTNKWASSNWVLAYWTVPSNSPPGQQSVFLNKPDLISLILPLNETITNQRLFFPAQTDYTKVTSYTFFLQINTTVNSSLAQALSLTQQLFQGQGL